MDAMPAFCLVRTLVQGCPAQEYAHAPKTLIGPWVWSYCRVLRGCFFLLVRYPRMVLGYRSVLR